MRYAIPLLLLFLACSSCVRQLSPPETSKLPKAVKSIAVLPSGVMSESGAPPSSPQTAKAMEQGLVLFDQILTEVFAANPKVRLLSEEEINVHSQSYSAGLVAQALEVGKGVKAEAVMLWGLERYTERSGGDYGVQTPASVAFQYRLLHVKSGQTLCAASFSETQQSAATNLLALTTFAKRGFKWVSASVLLREGVIKKIADCEYLKTSIGQEDDQEDEPYSVEDTTANELPPSVEAEKSSLSQHTVVAPPVETVSPAVIPAFPKETLAPTFDNSPDVQIEEISKFLEQWRMAWESTAGTHGDMNHYGSFYAVDFMSNNQDRDHWLAEKTRKNRSKEWIRLEISDIAITKLLDGLLEIHFTQKYSSSNYSDTSVKLLVLRKNGNNWEVVGER